MTAKIILAMRTSETFLLGLNLSEYFRSSLQVLDRLDPN